MAILMSRCSRWRHARALSQLSTACAAGASEEKVRRAVASEKEKAPAGPGGVASAGCGFETSINSESGLTVMMTDGDGGGCIPPSRTGESILFLLPRRHEANSEAFWRFLVFRAARVFSKQRVGQRGPASSPAGPRDAS